MAFNQNYHHLKLDFIGYHVIFILKLCYIAFDETFIVIITVIVLFLRPSLHNANDATNQLFKPLSS